MTAAISAPSADRDPRYPVLDALRFVLALWVAVSHYGVFPLFAGVDASTPVGHFLTHAWSTIVFGTPAVIVFFIISGFCIHLPFRGDHKLPIARFYFRRYTRILIPVVGALCVYRLAGDPLHFWGAHSILWESPLWSLLCEEIYYAAYPLLRFLRRILGWTALLAAAFVAAVATSLTHPHGGGWSIFGPLGTAVILLPVWLLGALLAEQAAALPTLDSSLRIWLWRFAAWFGCWSSEMLNFKAKIPSSITMIPFGVLAYFWVRKEIEFSRHRSPSKFLVAAGAWSYSLYLVHVQGMVFFGRLPLPNLGYILTWCFTILSALVFAWLFYILIERPSHRLARRIKFHPAPRIVPPTPLAEQTIDEPAP